MFRGVFHLRVALLPVLAALLMLAASAGARDHAGTKVTIVISGDQAPYATAADAVDRTLTRNSLTATRVSNAELTNERLSSVAPGEVLIAVGTEAALRLHKEAPEGVRVVYCMSSDSRELSAGRKSTRGVVTDVPIAEQVKLLTQALPKARRVGVIYRSSGARSAALKAQLEGALPDGMSVVAIDVDHETSVADAIRQLIASQPDVLWTAADSSVFNSTTVQALLKEAIAAKVPVFGFSTQLVRAGAIVGVGVRPEDQGDRAGALAVEAASAAAAGDAPIREGPKVRVAVNTLVAERLGFELPDDLLGKADDTFGK
ncbi:MAG: ABC transporter substrate-binding protein [Phycisphaerales bacterium]